MEILKTQLGDIKGKAGDKVVQYLGLKYAHLKNQLSAPELVGQYDKTSVIDATKYGPRAPAADMCQFEQTVLIQQDLSVLTHTPPMSGTDCLNLNITVPASASTSHSGNVRRLLPVMVFIHGGGFLMGSSHWPQYDPCKLVKASAEADCPVIFVNFNYRLGVLGNLTSSELRENGCPGNNSLRDQRCALQWVKEYIGEFGGDTGNITVFGESAGAVCVLHHLSAEEPLFDRAISMSGTPLMLQPIPIETTETAYEVVMKAFGFENLAAQERVKRLIDITPEELIAKTPMETPLVPFVDGDIVPFSTSFKDLAASPSHLQEKIPGYRWCKELMIGDCQHDGTVCYFMGLSQRKQNLASVFHTSLTTNLAPHSTTAASAVLAAYNITPTTPDDAAMKSILNFANDVLYYIPAKRFAHSFPGETYYYHFDVPNPWEGAFKGCATHLLDAAYLFGNFESFLGEKDRHVAREMGRIFLDFVNGQLVWGEGKVKRFALGGRDEEGNAAGYGGGRREVLCRLEEEGVVDLDELREAWGMFMAGK